MKTKQNRTVAAAIRAAGCDFEDRSGTVAERLRACAASRTGGDGEHTERERDLFRRAAAIVERKSTGA
jgi:hypothetical protein